MKKRTDETSRTSKWQDQPWATREAKKKDKPEENEEPWREHLDALHREYDNSPDEYRADLTRQMERGFYEQSDNIASGLITEALHSKNHECVKMQRMIDRMARDSKQFKKPPVLLIHSVNSGYPDAKDAVLSASIYLPGYINTNEFTIDYGSKHPEHFRVLMAHEMGHLVNNDQKVERQIIDNRLPPNQKNEVLADRMAAIIHGNPRKYALHMLEIDDFIAKEEGVDKYTSTESYLSLNANARMLHKWADILEREGATDAKGNVILDKALAVFERSKDLTEGLLAVDLMAKYPQFSR